MNPTPYRHAADRIVSRIAVPVLREPVFYCFMLLTFVWPQLTSDLFRIEATHWEILGLYIAYAYAATLPLGILGGKARRWYKAAAYTLAYAVSMAECFLLVFFRTFITPSLMSIATDTDPAESAEFIGCYLFTGRFALFLAAWSLVAGINLLLEKVSQARRTAPMPHAGLRTCLLTTVLAGGGIFGLTSNASAFESAWRLSRIHDRHELHELLREDPELCLERRIVADYDNAVRYNDRVVGEILDRCRTRDAVVVYLSDHGEEVFDYAHRNGRIHDATLSPDCCRHQYEIPFMIWMSDRYRAARPELAAAIARAVDRPYMTDDLPHLLLDLAGLSCHWFDPTRSVVNDRFDASRPRLLRDDKVDYDLIMRQAKGSAETNKGA